MRLVLVVLLLSITTNGYSQYNPDQVALDDRRQLIKSDGKAIYSTYYFTLHCAESRDRQSLYNTLSYICNTTSRQKIVEYCIPEIIHYDENKQPLLARIDTRKLKWSQLPSILQKEYPYTRVKLPLVINAEWFIQQVTDASKSTAYYQLLYGGDFPKTKSSFLAFWDVNNKVEHRFGLIEGNSGVSKSKIRWIENRPIARGYAWGTRDVFKISKNNDPLKNLVPPGVNFKADGEEWIIGIPKVSISQVPVQSGTVQIYALFNGKGKLINKADGDLVEDLTKFKGLSQIRTPGSCIQCHVNGLNTPSVNEFQRLILKGVDTYALFKDREAIEIFHLSDINKEITRNNEDFGNIQQLGWSRGNINKDMGQSRDFSTTFKKTIDSYIKKLPIETAARELSTTKEELSKAISYQSALGKNLSPRIVGLVHDIDMPRSVFEDEYVTLVNILENWRKVNAIIR